MIMGLQCQCEAGRAGAHDQDVGVDWPPHATPDRPPPGRRRRPAPRGSSRPGSSSTWSRRGTRQAHVVDGPGRAPSSRIRHRQRRIMLGAPGAVPLVNAAIDSVLIVRQPQLGHEAGEPHEQRGVEQALPAERVYVPQPRTSCSRNSTTRTQGSAIGPAVDDCLAIDPSRGAICEIQPRPCVLARQAYAPRASSFAVLPMQRISARAATARGNGV